MVFFLCFLDGERIAKSTSIDNLLRQNFYIVINDLKYYAKVPDVGKTSFCVAFWNLVVVCQQGFCGLILEIENLNLCVCCCLVLCFWIGPVLELNQSISFNEKKK